MSKKNLNKKAVFIGGCSRSGTTMLGSMLGTHHECLTTPESHFKQTIPLINSVNINGKIKSKEFIKVLKTLSRFKVWDIRTPENEYNTFFTNENYRDYLLSLVDIYSQRHNPKNWKYWIDHTPQNFQQASTLQKIFPEAKFVHIVRDPRAIFASVLKLDWGPIEAVEMAEWWGYKLSFALAYSQFNGNRCMTIRYEDIVKEPENMLLKLCEFVGITYLPDMIYGTGFKLPNYTKEQHKLVGKKPDQSRLNKWRNDLKDKDIYTIEKHVGDMMQLFDYDLTFRTLEKRTNIQKISDRIGKYLLKFKKWYRFKNRVKNI